MQVPVVLFTFLFVNCIVGSRVILVENAPTCFRRVLAGHRALRSFVRRVLPCEALQDCTRACATETRFHCESFNYRLDPTFRGKGLCELMTRPIEAFNIRRDFVEDKDYDFYEIDRNSLEPNCPETLSGPGLLHSGFLSSKPNRVSEDRWRDRNDWQTRHHYDYDNDNRFYDDRKSGDRFHSSGRRRYQDQDRFYIPYQIGIPTTARIDDEDQDKWGKYGGIYGGSNNYYKNRNDYHKSINYWRINTDIELPRDYGVKPIEKTKFDPLAFAKRHFGVYGSPHSTYEYGYGPWKKGRWNTSGVGNSLGHETEYKTFKPSHFYGPIDRDDHSDGEDVSDCSSRRRPGMSLGSGAIRRSLHARNVLQCEAACFDETEFKCVSYSFRYSSPPHSDNCFLSERPYRGLHLSVDTESDVYAMPQGHSCVTKKPWVESECFWHVRSGAAIDVKSARALLTVAGLGACEAECIRATGFFCRGFSFRFEPPTIGDDLENCILTSSPATSLGAGHLRPSSGHELYSRGNYGRGCEPALYDVQDTARECYLQHDKAARLLPSSIKGRARVDDERACGHACTHAPFNCYSFSYNNKSPPHTDNCFLSEVRLFDLQRGVDYEHSVDDWLFAYDLFNSECWKKKERGGGKGYIDESSHELPHPISPSSVDHHGTGPPGIYLPTSPAEPPYISSSGPPSGPPIYKPSHPIGPDSKPYLPEARPEYTTGGFKPGYPPPEPHYYPTGPSGPSGPPSGPSGPPTGPSGPTGTFKPLYPVRPDPVESGYKPAGRPGYGTDRGDVEPASVSLRHYTVSGFPCARGSACAQNSVAGHWACEPEGGEVGSWDYCCAPTHRCGYSEGFNKPWCYVGPNNDQWRPCSEKYYPYHQHNVPHPTQGNTGPPRPWTDPPARGPHIAESDRRYWDDLFKNGPKGYYDKHGDPLPGYSRVPMHPRPPIHPSHNYNDHGSGRWMPADNRYNDVPGLGAPRYWPVAYLHKGPPPNMTYFRYNETYTTTTERYHPILRIDNTDSISSKNQPIPDYKPVYDNRNNVNNNVEYKNNRDEKNRNINNVTKDIFTLNLDGLKTTSTTSTTTTTTTTEVPKIEKPVVPKVVNISEVETVKPENFKADKKTEELKGIDGKLEDFAKSIEVVDISDVERIDKSADLKSLEAEEEKQIEAIGRLLAHRRGGKLIVEKRSQQDLKTKNIAVDNTDYSSFDFDFPTRERRGKIQKVTKEEIERERNQDKSLELSETTYVRPPRVLSTTENIRKAIINGKVFYDATIREQRDVLTNSTRNFRFQDQKVTSTTPNSNFGKKQGRKINPIRRVRRIYRRKYNPGEVRKRLLEKERSTNVTIVE